MRASESSTRKGAGLARAFIVGNGSILASGDRQGTLRELYAPSFDPGHQLLRRPARVGCLVDGALHWIDERFEAHVAEGGDAPIVALSLVSMELELEAWMEFYVDLSSGVVARRVQITNRSGRFRDLRLLFHHDLKLSPGEPREGAYRDGRSGGIVHHAGRRFALINLEGSDGVGVPLWKVSARPSEDDPGAESLAVGGRIEGPEEARGRVDSIVAAPTPLGPDASTAVTVWIATGGTLEQARERDASYRRAGIGASVAKTRAHWNLWLRQGPGDLLDLPEDVATVYHRSLVILRLHQNPAGAILSGVEAAPAAGARAEYRWCWNRDAAIAADALGRAGYLSCTRRYLEFVARSAAEAGTLPPVLDAAGAPAATPHDLDGIALFLWALARHFEREHDVEFAAPLYQDLVLPAAEELAKSIDPGLHLPASHDLWDERAGFHASTAAAVRSGLRAVSRLALRFGDTTRAQAWGGAADEVARAIGRELYRPEWGRFTRSLTRVGRALRPDPTIDASLLWLGLFDDAEAEDPRVCATTEVVRAALWVRTGIGGIARYERDPLGSVGTELPDIPGNPWIAATLWLAQHTIRTAKRAKDLDPARTLLLWCAARAEGWGALPEQLHPYRGETTAPSPSLLAHAWLVGTVADYVERFRLLRRCDRCGAPAPTRSELSGAGTPGPLLPSLVAHP